MGRKRRSFSAEFKAEAVGLCRVGDRSIKQVAKDLDLTETALREWVRRAGVDAGEGPPGPLTTVEREELSRLRKQVKRLEMEREILKNSRGGGPNLLGEKLGLRYVGGGSEGAAVCFLEARPR